MSDDPVQPFRVEIPDAQVADLRERLARTRWPERETVEDWSQGTPLAYLRELCEHWHSGYEMDRLATRLNAFPQLRVRAGGLGIHVLHARSPHAEATPLLMTHGWPGSVLEFLDAIPALTDPTAHGGEARDAFHVVCPTLPGYGWSEKPTETGWGPERIAAAWAELMESLGYERYVAQGGDWGAIVTTELGRHAPERLIGIHLNYAALSLNELSAVPDLTPEERDALERMQRFRGEGRGYSIEQGTRPQTVGYGLVDSPAAQCAWIVEKFQQWSDCNGHPENAFSRDALLDTVMLYWLTGTATSSARLYWERNSTVAAKTPVTVPTAYSAFPKELADLSARWVALRFPDLRYHRHVERGGHFAAMEQPELFTAELRAALRTF